MSQLTRPLEVIETEINFYKQQTARNMIEYAHLCIGKNATIKQISNFCSNKFSLPSKLVFDLIVSSAIETEGDILE